LGIALHESTPDHSTLTLTRKRLPPEVFAEVFEFVLRIAHEKRLLSGQTVGVDSTLLEADAAMKSIVRRDTGEDWKQYVTRLMREEGVVAPDEQPSDEDIRRYDKRRPKKVSNEESVSRTDPESCIAQLKDGRTHLAYKAEHVVDLESDLLLAAEILPATAADTETLVDSVLQAQVQLEAAGSEQQGGMRRTWLHGLVDTGKRHAIAAAAYNLSRIQRTLFGIGKPRPLQGPAALPHLPTCSREGR